MAEREELQARRQLQQALQSGDARAELHARRQLQNLGAAADRQYNDEGVPIVEPPSNTATQMSRVGAGVGEMILSLGTGAVAQPLAGLEGIGQLIYSTVRGDDNPLQAASDRVERVSEALTYQPKTAGGRFVAESVGKPLQKIGEMGERAGTAAMEATGDPGMGAAVQTGVESAPMLLGVRRPRVSPGQRRRDVREIESQAEELDFDLGASGARQREQVTAAGERMTGGRQSRAEPFPEIQASVQQARQATKETVDQLYDEARASRAGVPAKSIQEFSPVAQRSLQTFDVETMPIVKRRLSELDEVNALPPNSAVKLEALDKWRQRLNKNRPAATDTSQAAALNVLKGQFDNFIEAQFNADMISGSPLAVSKWKDARGAFRQYKQQFDENRVISQLARKEATPEEMRNWVFGASTTGAKKQAADTVKRLKEIIGEDSPQIAALRQDALIDVMEPLFREQPNLKQFANNYDRLIRTNKSLANELFPESQQKALKSLRNFAQAAQKRSPDAVMRDLNRIGAVALFGHGIAKAGLKVRLAQNAFGFLRRAGDKSARRQIMGDILGYDPYASLIPKSPALIGSAVQTGQKISQDEALETE